MHVWRKVYHTEAIITESNEEVERITLTIPFNGNELDIEAMLKLYNDTEDIDTWDESDSLSGKSASEPLYRKDLSDKKRARNTR